VFGAQLGLVQAVTGVMGPVDRGDINRGVLWRAAEREIGMETRRRFLAASTQFVLAAGGAALASGLVGSAEARQSEPLHIASNEFSWSTFFKRDRQTWSHHDPRCLSRFADSGVMGMEPIVTSVEDVAKLSPLLREFRQEMRSIYVNARLHDRAVAGESVARVLAIAEEARHVGTQIVVTNPEPIEWGGTQDKSDAELICQAEHLDTLGAELNRLGLRLAYHNHGSELRSSAREFHHMLVGTNSRHVALCLDAHWIYRGSGNSQVCLFDIVTLYAERIVELHLRQSHQGVWAESFGAGDIDYQRLAKVLAERGIHPHIVLEQAVEAGSPKTVGAIDAHRTGLLAARALFEKANA
jgi:inosose dehydratase